jgi:DNA mismatch repair ATPase MutS
MHYLDGRNKEFMELYCFIGGIDLCLSIASFRQSIRGYCIPEFIDAGTLDIEEIYHPLVREPIKNTLDMTKNILLTGSNASGKSTFIKAVAINIILAQSIYTCMASKMRIPDARVITSMAIRDDIMSGESYYIKEIKYLQRIIEESTQDRMVICTIDEILRGTNTNERVAASIAVLKYLNEKNCMVLVASHDLELAKQLENMYDMYYFCEKLKGNDVIFDYKLREGISHSRNAIRLLQLIGFPNEIVEVAKELCAL